MISFALATALVFTAAQSGPPMEPRNEFADCLSRFSKAKEGEKLDEAVIRPALKSACAAEAEAFRSSIVKYDIKMGAKKASAEQNVWMEIEDYFTNSVESYLVHTKGPTKKD